MKKDIIQRILLVIVIISTIVLTIISIKVVDKILTKYNYEIISNKPTTIFSIISLSYCASLILVSLIKNILQKLYVKTNEQYIQEIDYKYYREIINNYSIGTLIKCYGKKVSYRDELVAMLLRLLINKKVKLNNSTIEIIDESGLTFSENMFIKSCRGVCIYKKKNIKKQLDEDNIKDSLETDLFSKEVINSTDLYDKVIRLGYVLWILNFIFLVLSGCMKNYIGLIISFVCHILILVSFLFYDTKNILYRTEKGKDIQYKLIGLKNYLKDYSNMYNKGIKEIEVWDEYIIYAIIFNLKGKLDIEAYETYKKYVEKNILK